jgi:acyl-CoA dehydrogenase
MTLEDRAMLIEMTSDLFDRATPLMGRLSATDAALGRMIWDDVEQAELSRVGTAAERGGAGGGIADACAVLRMASRFAPPVPLAETQLASWVLAEAGLPIPSGPLAIGPTALVAAPELRADGAFAAGSLLPPVPFAGFSTKLVVVARRGGETVAALVDLDGAKVEPALSYSAEPWATVDLSGVRPAAAAVVGVSLDDLHARGALCRSQQIAGALAKVLELSVEYSGERNQFGRPINRFQAIQHHLADIAAETIAAGVAAEAAAELAEAGKLNEAAGIAKSRTGLAARAAAVAHQVHGAIGVTEEHPLHLFTRRIWDWRDDFGSDVEWSGRLGRQIARAGASALWPEVSEIL